MPYIYDCRTALAHLIAFRDSVEAHATKHHIRLMSKLASIVVEETYLFTKSELGRITDLSEVISTKALPRGLRSQATRKLRILVEGLSAANVPLEDIVKKLDGCRGKLRGSLVDDLIAAAMKENDPAISKAMHRDFVIRFVKGLEECGNSPRKTLRC